MKNQNGYNGYRIDYITCDLMICVRYNLLFLAVNPKLDKPLILTVNANLLLGLHFKCDPFYISNAKIIYIQDTPIYAMIVNKYGR